MTAYELPTSLNISGVDFSIRTDFRKIIGILIALGNPNFSNEAKAIIAVQIMYEKWWEIPEENLNEALQKA